MKVTIKTRILGSFICTALIFGITSAIALYNMVQTNKSYEYILDHALEVRSAVQNVQTNSGRQTAYLRGYLLYGTDDMKDNMYKANEKINTEIERAGTIATLEETGKRLKSIEKLNEEWIKSSDQSVDKQTSDKKEAIRIASEQVVPISTKITEETDSFYVWLSEVVQDERAAIKAQTASTVKLILGLSLLAFAVSIVYGFLNAKAIVKPLRKLMAAAEQVASGDLNVAPIEMKTKDELFLLKESFGKMTRNLQTTVRMITSHSSQVAASAEQLTSSADQSTTAAETMAAAVEEMAAASEKTSEQTETSLAAVEKVVQGILRISDNAVEVTEMAKGTGGQAEEGSRYVESSAAQMKSIQESALQSNHIISELAYRSNEIGKIIDVINDIAAQTNLLALNAAIEAARAGEHGKGFAVVAEEVRKLAEQSQASTKMIADIVKGIQADTAASVANMKHMMEDAEEGVRISAETSKKFSSILESTLNVQPKLEEITLEIQQISGGMEKVSESSAGIAAVSQTNAASTEEAAASTEEQLASMEEINASARALASMADELNVVVNQFKL